MLINKPSNLILTFKKNMEEKKNELVANSSTVNSFNCYTEENFHNEKRKKFSFLNSAAFTPLRDLFMIHK